MGKDADGETADELRGSKVPFEACDGGENVLFPVGGGAVVLLPLVADEEYKPFVVEGTPEAEESDIAPESIENDRMGSALV
jgi:hypothetical protein